MNGLRGAITALLTPFRDGRINGAVYETDIDRQIENGIAGIVACGTTAETPTLTEEERHWLIRSAVVSADGRVPVIAGTGTNSTADTIEATRMAKRLGADAALVVTPYYNRPSQEGLYHHFEAVAARADIPIILYNVPTRTGVDLTPETVARLSRLEGIVGIKDAAADALRCRSLRQSTPEGFAIYAGDDGSTLPVLLSGGDGAISVISNAFPAEWSNLCRLALDRRIDEASSLEARFAPLVEAMALETNPCPIKYLMSLVCSGHSTEVRLPLMPINARTAERIRTALDAVRGHYMIARNAVGAEIRHYAAP